MCSIKQYIKCREELSDRYPTNHAPTRSSITAALNSKIASYEWGKQDSLSEMFTLVKTLSNTLLCYFKMFHQLQSLSSLELVAKLNLKTINVYIKYIIKTNLCKTY